MAKFKLNYPLKPRPDNFTPPERTPWGGTRIAEMKAHLGVKPGTIIGESWEISSHPKFPNRFIIEEDGVRKEVTCADLGLEIPFIAKLLNSREKLSVQVHPNEDYKGLKPGEHSKTEGWYIIEAEKRAGIYLGLKEGIDRPLFEKTLKSGGDVTGYLNFIEVKPGDIFFIPAGTPHAIGAGILLYEPQERSETTYRIYDYGRGRALHVEDALAAIDWSAPRGRDFVEKVARRHPSPLPVIYETLIKEDKFSLSRIRLNETQPWSMVNGPWSESVQGLTCIEGFATVSTNDGEWGKITKGESLIIPPKAGRYRLANNSPSKAVFLQTV